MKHLLTLFICLPLLAAAQNISVKSFRSAPEDMTARVTAPIKDQNGEKCALIKVRTTQTGFVFEGDMLGITRTIQEVGEIWVYVPNKAKKLTIKHAQLGVMDNYLYAEPIKEATVYIMELTTSKVKVVVEDEVAATQWVVITSEPAGADVFINELNKGLTPFQMEMEEGSYTYRISKELYHSEAGKFELIDKKVELSAKLKDNFGFITIVSSPETGMSIDINGTPTGKVTPYTTERMKSGKYKINVTKPLFYNTTKEVEVMDGQTNSITLESKPAFGGISVESKPEAGAAVLLDDKETGLVTPCQLDKIASGSHTITLKREWFEPQSKKITVTDGKTEKASFEMLPTFGSVSVITGTDCELTIDGKIIGKGNWKGRLIAGYHTLETKKDKHHPASQKVQVQLGQTSEITLEPKPIQGTLKIVTQPMGAAITLNGTSYGTTPNTISKLLIGDYKLVVKKDGFSSIDKTVKITENQTTEVNETLLNATQITVNTTPTGASVTLNNKSVGVTPLKVDAPFGKNSLVLNKSGYVSLTENIQVTEANRTFSFKLTTDQALVYQKKIKQNKAYKITYTFLGIGAAGASLYYYFDAQSKYKDYKGATTDATNLHQQVVKSRNNAIIFGSAAAISGVAALICKSKVKKYQAKLSYGAYVLPKDGKGVWLAYRF